MAMHRLQLLAITFVLMLTTAAAFAEKPKSKSAKPKLPSPQLSTAELVDVVQMVHSLSEDKLAKQLQFDNFQVSVSGKTDQLIATREVTIAMPVKNVARPTTVRQTLNLGIAVTAGTRAVMVVEWLGQTELVDLPATTDKIDVTKVFEGHVGPGESCDITIFLLTERDTADENLQAALWVDSLAVELFPGEDPGCDTPSQ